MTIPLYDLLNNAYLFVRDNSPEKVREFINAHPAYTAGLEGVVLGAAIGSAVTLAAIYGSKLIRKGMEKKREEKFGNVKNYSNKVQDILYKAGKIRKEK